MAVFRWKGHDEKINLNAKMASEYAMEFHPDPDGLTDIRVTQRETYDGAISFCETTISSLKNQEDKLRSKSDVEPVARRMVNNYAQKQLESYVIGLKDMGDKTHLIRRYFNWPFYFSMGTILLYVMQRAVSFNLILNLLIGLGILFSLYGFYCLFNFSYNPGETDGFDKLPKVIKDLPIFRKNSSNSNYANSE